MMMQPLETFKNHQLFPKTDQSFYVNRPFISNIIGLGLISLATLRWLPLGLATKLGCGLLLDDILIYPIQQIRKYIHNIRGDVKLVKSWIGVFSTLIGYMFGALFAHALLIHLPITTFVVAALSHALGINFITLAAIEISGIFIANMLRRPAYEGVVAALLLLPFLPSITLSATADFYALMSLSFGFLTCYAVKQLMRLISKIRYGHTNADGYYYNLDLNVDDAPTELDYAQAARLDVDPQLITELRHSLLISIDYSRQQTPAIWRFLGADKACTAELKNILHLLMTTTAADKNRLITLLGITSRVDNALYDQTLPETHRLRKYQQHTNIPTERAKIHTFVDSSRGLARIKHARVFKKAAPVTSLANYHRHGFFSAEHKNFHADSINLSGCNLKAHVDQLFQAIARP
jgi:hypothetical protein